MYSFSPFPLNTVEKVSEDRGQTRRKALGIICLRFPLKLQIFTQFLETRQKPASYARDGTLQCIFGISVILPARTRLLSANFRSKAEISIETVYEKMLE